MHSRSLPVSPVFFVYRMVSSRWPGPLHAEGHCLPRIRHSLYYPDLAYALQRWCIAPLRAPEAGDGGSNTHWRILGVMKKKL